MVDQMIRDIAHRHRAPEPGDAQRIRDHLAVAPFNSQRVRVQSDVRGLTYQGRTVQSRDESVFIHVVRRVLKDRQWVEGTTVSEYVADLRRMVSDRSASLLIYDTGQGPVAGIYVANTVPFSRRGVEALPNAYVVYASDRRSIVTGYQVSDISTVNIPEDAQWLT